MTPSQGAVRPISFVSKSSPSRKQRRPGPAKPNYGISPELWPDVLRHVEQGESLRQVAKVYSVSYETVRRVLRAIRKGEGE